MNIQNCLLPVFSRGAAVFFSIVTILCHSGLDAAQVVLPISPSGQVWVKQVPHFFVVGTEIKGDPFLAIDAANLKLSQFVAMQRMETIKPLILEFPDLNWRPDDSTPVLFCLPLALPRAPEHPKDDLLIVEQRDSGKVASISFSGEYIYENMVPHMVKLAEWLKRSGTVVAGRPRLLIYHYRAFRPDFTREAELQIPIR